MALPDSFGVIMPFRYVEIEGCNSELNKKSALLELDHKLLEQRESSDIWILASPVKKEAFDLMIEKSCELGAAKFMPVICEHTVVRRINQERLQAISIEAAEQSERLDVMAVDPLMDLKKALVSELHRLSPSTFFANTFQKYVVPGMSESTTQVVS